MKLYVDLDTLQLIEFPGFRNPVSSLRFKRGDAATLDVTFLTGGNTPTVIGDPESLQLVFGAKMLGRYDLGYLVFANDWTMPYEGDASLVYVCHPSFNTTALDAAMHVGEGSGLELAEVTLMGELTWVDGGVGPTSTSTINVTVENDVNRGTEGTPVTLQSPDDWIESRRPAPIQRTLGEGPPVNGVFASLTVDPSGANNSVLFTAVNQGVGGNAITVGYAAPSSTTAPLVAVSGNTITVTPAAKQNMVVAGAGTTGANGTYVYDAALAGWTNGTNKIVNVGGLFKIIKILTSGILYAATTATTWPDEAAYSVQTGTTPAPYVACGFTTAAQVIDAVNACTPAALLVVASASGTVTGTVTYCASAPLAGGAGTIGALGQACYVDLTNLYVCVRAIPTKWVAIPPAGTTARTDIAQTFAGVQTFTSPPVFSAIPRVSAYKNAADQVLTAGSYTTVNFDAEEYDTQNNFAANAFTAPYACYVRVTGAIYISAGTTGLDEVAAKVNGSVVRRCLRSSIAAGSIVPFSYVLKLSSGDVVTIGYYGQFAKTVTAGAAITYVNFEVLP